LYSISRSSIHIAANQRIAESNERLVAIVRECTDALLRDANERKREEINSMLAEYGIDAQPNNETESGASTQENDPQNLLSFRKQRSSGDG